MIPQTFEQWKYCITIDCKINLTKEFALIRLDAYSDPGNPETQTFITLYGTRHLQNVIHWFKKIAHDGI